MSNFILIDSCYWIALLDEGSDPREKEMANTIADLIDGKNLVIPYPTLYEFINSRLSRRDQRTKLEAILKKPNVQRINDENYKEQALEMFFANSRLYINDHSLVDEIIKLMLNDKNLKIDYLVTFDRALKNAATSIGKKIIE